jgi:hypothetical protein
LRSRNSVTSWQPIVSPVLGVPSSFVVSGAASGTSSTEILRCEAALQVAVAGPGL